MPNMEAERTEYKIEVPYLGSLILTHTLDGAIQGLKTWPPDERPYAPIVFWSFRIMVGIGVLILALGLWSLVLRWQGRLYTTAAMHRAAMLMGPTGFVAVLAGWVTTEVGRQPWTVYGLLTTAQSASSIDAAAVGASLIAFIVVYFTLFGVGVYYILRLMGHLPHPGEPGLPPDEPVRAAGITPAPQLEQAGVLRPAE
jgi:cytochrome d ubiquinol oxidase subunit I